jgi:hypothetical protein
LKVGTQFDRQDDRGKRQLLAAALLACLMLAQTRPATALVVDPFFAGSVTLDAQNFNAVCAGSLYCFNGTANVGFEYLHNQSSVYIDYRHGIITDGGIASGGDIVPGYWGYDDDIWAPLYNNMDLFRGGQITWGNPASGVFAVSFVNVVNADDPTIRNTYQVILIGPSTTYHTNSGIAILPGSVIFAYGGSSNPNGTVNLSANSPAAIGVFVGGQLTTLSGFGIGGANGVLNTTTDIAALRNSGDPFLFNFNSDARAFDKPVGFASIPELVPEPSTALLISTGIAALATLGRRKHAGS